MTAPDRPRARRGAPLMGGVSLLVCALSAAALIAFTGGPGHPRVAGLLPDLQAWFGRLSALSLCLSASTAALLLLLFDRPAGARADAAVARLFAALDPRRAQAFVWCGAGIYTLVFALYTSARHDRLNSTGYDLAIEAQVLWSLAHGRGFASSIEVPNYLGDHFVPSYALLAPLLWIWDDVRMLLTAQSAWLALGGPALFRLALRRTGDPLLALLLGLGYFLVPAVGFMNKFDAHYVTAALPVLLWALAMEAEDRKRWWVALLLFALTIREEVGLAAGPIAFFAMRRPGYRRLGLVVGSVCLAWSVLALFVWIPHFRAGLPSDTLERYAYLGSTPREIVLTLLREPWRPFLREMVQLRRFIFLFQLGLPTGFLALLSPGALLSGSLVFFQNLWSDNLSQAAIYLHYVAPVIPFVLAAWAGGVARLARTAWSRRPGGRTVVLAWVAAAPVAAQFLDAPLRDSVPWPYVEVYGLERDLDADAFARLRSRIPDDAAVLASETLAAQFAHRAKIQVYHTSWAWVVRKEIRSPVPGVMGPWDGDWIVLDLRSRRHQEYPERARADAIAWIAGGYRVGFCEGGFLGLTRSAPEDPQALTRWQEELRRYPPKQTDSALPPGPDRLAP